MLPASTRLGPYEILAPLGAGGMGEVYRARDSRLDRELAIKLLPPAFTSDPDRLRRFVLEARAASALNNPNILTIYEIGHADGHQFIATELVDGQTLRQRMRQGRMPLAEVLDVAVQIAQALAAAHAAGIAHRDIKPENVMVRPDGLVKVLDFGLAKLAAGGHAADAAAPTRTAGATDPGVVLGTASYMSPEQARGLEVDGRSDIFSLGVVIYEMLTGRSPFERETVSDAMAAVLTFSPSPITAELPSAPAELARLVGKALRKDRDERYQSVKDLAVDLKDLKQGDDAHAADRPKRRKKKSGGAAAVRTPAPGDGRAEPARRSARRTSASPAGGTTATRIRWRLLTAGAALLLIAAAAATYYFGVGGSRAPALTERDSIVVADFVNTTGESVFDGALKQALAVALEQTPFLNVFPDERIHDTLRRMGRPVDERVTRAVAREICQREGLKALIAGSISSLGRNYVIALDAISAESGEVIAREQVEAGSREEVLGALGRVASRLRGRLGESLSSIETFNTPLPDVTTSSLEALRAFSSGRSMALEGREAEAIPLFRRAVELDPNFAAAHLSASISAVNAGQSEAAREWAEQAYLLRQRASPRERLRIESRYANVVHADLDQTIEVQELYMRTYPHEIGDRIGLAYNYYLAGRYEETIEMAREVLRLGGRAYQPYTHLGAASLRLGRFEEAKAPVREALDQQYRAWGNHAVLYAVAAIEGDAATMRQQIDAMAGRPDEYQMFSLQARYAASLGQLRSALDLSRRGRAVAGQRGLDEAAAQLVADDALRQAVLGRCADARQTADDALALSRERVVLDVAGRARAVCGDRAAAEAIAEELSSRFPRATLTNNVWLPVMRALLDVQRDQPAGALQRLEVARRYERAAAFWPAYVRGLASLRQRHGTDAAAHFRQILEHRGEDTLSPLLPLAHLGLARAALLTGDTRQARTSYQDVLAFWKDADPDLPVLLDVRREYQALAPE